MKIRIWNSYVFRSCLMIIGYCITLVVIVFLAEALQGEGKGAVYAMSSQSNFLEGKVRERQALLNAPSDDALQKAQVFRWGGGVSSYASSEVKTTTSLTEGMEGEDWRVGSIQANLENVLKSSVNKYLEPEAAAMYGGDPNEAMIRERQVFLEQSSLGWYWDEGEQEVPLPTEPEEGEQEVPPPTESEEGEQEVPPPTESEEGEQEVPPPTEPIEEVQEVQPTDPPREDASKGEKTTAKKSNKPSPKKVVKKAPRKKANNPRHLSLSQEDKQVLLRIVEAEAGGENMKGKMLVANVVINRVKSKSFPSTVKKVVFQYNRGTHQFSPISDGRYWRVRISNHTREAVAKVLKGADQSSGALYFMCRKYAKPHNVKWFDSNLRRLYRCGAHEFYK